MKKIQLILTALRQPKAFIIAGFKEAEELKRKKYLEKKYERTQLPSIDLLDLFPGFHQTVDPYSFLTGTSMITDIALLKGLASRYPSCAYLEIGMWRGESLVNVAAVTRDCTALTLSEEEMLSMGMSKEYTSLHGFFTKDLDFIDIRYVNSFHFDFQSLNKKFDLIFIDGDHTYEGVKNDTAKVFPLLKDEHSVIVWHDYGFSTEEVRYSVMAAILDGLPASAHQHVFHVSNTMCAVFTRETHPTSVVTYPSVPDKEFIIEVKAAKL